jgi:alginate O-acetyltransferase complex protein AlgI
LIFNSFIFVVFATCFFLVWPLLRQQRSVRWAYLISASFFFYGWWDWRYLFLIVFSGLIDYFAGYGIERYPSHRKLMLIFSIVGNVGSLAIFKYSRFIAHNIDALSGALGISTRLSPNIPIFMTSVPVGISFYTFQSMSYTIDVYRGQSRAARNILHFFAYLSLFPQLVAGPIVRARDLLPQLARQYKPTALQKWEGLQLVIQGYFKKVVVADNLAPIVNAAFGASSLQSSTPFWWLMVAMFGIQIYCDFSGYSDIAMGLAKWMGYDFELNFNHPYISKTLREFWGRWHISLSTWFRDYVYIPLGGSRVSKIKYYRNIWLTMLISGLWHGASWTFVVWGAFHAFFLSIERYFRWPDKLMKHKIGPFLSTTFTLTTVWFAWVFFRSQSIDQAWTIIGHMLAFNFSTFQVVDTVLFAKATLITFFWVLFELHQGLGRPGLPRIPQNLIQYANEGRLAFMLAACLFLRGPGSAFIYFQF